MPQLTSKLEQILAAAEAGTGTPQAKAPAPIDPQEIHDYLISKGLDENQSKGILANIKAESGFNPAAAERGVSVGGVGLFQHTANRREALKQAVPDWQNNWKGQIDFALAEPETQKYIGSKFDTPEDATKWFTKHWEAPPNAHSKANYRASNIPDVSTKPRTLDDILAANDTGPIEDVIPQPEPTPSEQIAQTIAPTPSPSAVEQSPKAASALAGSQSFLDALGVGALSRLGGKTDTGKNFSENFNNGLDIIKSLATRGNTSGYVPQTIEERAKSRQSITQEAQKEHPIVSGAGTVAGILAPVGAPNLVTKGVTTAASKVPALAKMAAESPKIASLVKLLTEGATQGGTYEAVSNKDASTSSITKAAKTGSITNALLGPVVSTGAKVTGKVGGAILNRFLKAKTPEVAPYVAQHIGVAKNLDDFVAKNEAAIKKNVEELQSFLDNESEKLIGKKLIPLPKHMRSQDILDAAEYMQNIRAVDASDELLNIAARADSQGGKLSVGDANKIKQYFQGQSYGKSGPLSSDASKVFRDWATELRGSIEGAFGNVGKTGKESAKLGNKVAKLNQDIATGFQVKKHLQKAIERDISSGGMSGTETAAILLTGGTAAPLVGANRLSKTSFVSTGLNKASKVAKDKLGSSVPDSMKTLLNTLVPQYGKK